MEISLSQRTYDYFRRLRKAIDRDLRCVGLPCNNIQYACAVAAVSNRSRPRVIVQIPSGRGKSRVMAAVIALKARQLVSPKFAIVFSSELLRDVDGGKYEQLAELLDVHISLVVFDPEKAVTDQIDSDFFLLIDEADQVLLDHATRFYNAEIVGLTATQFIDELEFERDWLENHKYHCIDSKLEGFIDPDDVVDSDLIGFMKAAQGYGKLIYATGDDIERVKSEVTPTLVDCDDLQVLKKLGPDDVLLISKPCLMRGIDYRCDQSRSRGLAIIIMSQFGHTRDLIQGLGRVGRYHEAYLRFKSSHMTHAVDLR